MDNNEQTRKNLKVNATQHAFMVERTLAKQYYNNCCREIRQDCESKNEVIKRMCELECNKNKAIADKACIKAQMEYFDKVAEIAEREDAFKHEIAEYIASLQPAVNPGGGGLSNEDHP